VVGPDQVFTTSPPILPVAALGETTGVAQNAATINASINAQGEPTRWELQMGTTRGNLQFQAAGHSTSSTPEPLVLNLVTLAPGTVYYYKLTAADPDGTIETPEGEFKTAPASPTGSGIPLPTTALFQKEAKETEKEPGGKKTVKKLTNAQKLAKALKACNKQPKNKRAACKKQAQKKYGHKSKKKKK